MDEVFEYVHSCNQKDLDEFFRLKIEIGTGEEEHNEKQKENEKDEKKTYNKQFEWCNIFCLA